MKKLLFTLTLLFSISLFSQELTVTPDGLRDASNNDKSYVVINTPDKTAEQNYNNVLKYINKTYNNPKEAIKANISFEYLKFDTFISDFLITKNGISKDTNDARFSIEISFRNDKVKFEVVSLSIYNDAGYEVLFSGGAFSGFAIYNKKKTKLKKPKTKKDIEVYFNNTINNIKGYLLEDIKSLEDVKLTDDDW